MTLMVIGGILAFGVGIYIGLGHPGIPGPNDRVLPSNMRRKPVHTTQFLDWLRPRKR